MHMSKSSLISHLIKGIIQTKNIQQRDNYMNMYLLLNPLPTNCLRRIDFPPNHRNQLWIPDPIQTMNPIGKWNLLQGSNVSHLNKLGLS